MPDQILIKSSIGPNAGLARTGGRYAMLLWTLVRIGFWVGIAGALHRNKWYWAV